MDVLRRFLLDGAERDYNTAVRLTTIDSKTDPVTEPYRSLYRAREIWQTLKAGIEACTEKLPPSRNYQRNDNCSENEKPINGENYFSDEEIVWKVLSAVVDLKLGVNYAETEEKSSGEEHLKKCFERLDDIKFDQRACNVCQMALNQLGILCGEIKAKMALDPLIRAECLHRKFSETVGTSPWTPDDLFSVQSYDEGDLDAAVVQKRMEAFEDAHTHTLYFLAQVYEKLDESELSARYCHATLRRQMSSRRYVALDWALNAATLAQYYFAVNDFVLSRHCLASAELVLAETGPRPESLYVPYDDEDDDNGSATLSSRERVPKAWADLARCWAKYGIAMLDFSRERLYRAVDDDNADPVVPKPPLKPPSHNSDVDGKESETGAAPESAKAELVETKDERRKLFFDLELTALEDRMTDVPVCLFSEARDVFLRTQEWLEAAKDFYRLDGHCSDHVAVVRDHSTLYKLLAFFEGDLERQCKMHKRRADMIQAVLKQLNVQYYLLVCRQLMFELAEIYSMMLRCLLRSAMLDNKLELQSTQSLTDHARHKINVLAHQSITQFGAYVDSLRDARTKQLPTQFQDDDERPALAAHFYMGRLHSKLLDADPRSQLINVRASLDCYSFIVDYCRRNPEARAKVSGEIGICEEMVTLLPAKMEKILARINAG